MPVTGHKAYTGKEDEDTSTSVYSYIASKYETVHKKCSTIKHTETAGGHLPKLAFLELSKTY
jgi:hypothetical protein